ncbi:PENK isoform 1, partial [Pongo abelii]
FLRLCTWLLLLGPGLLATVRAECSQDCATCSYRLVRPADINFLKHPHIDQFIHSTNEYLREEAPDGGKSQCNASKWRYGVLMEKQQDL